jgi:hypothetical protein
MGDLGWMSFHLVCSYTNPRYVRKVQTNVQRNAGDHDRDRGWLRLQRIPTLEHTDTQHS